MVNDKTKEAIQEKVHHTQGGYRRCHPASTICGLSGPLPPFEHSGNFRSFGVFDSVGRQTGSALLSLWGTLNPRAHRELVNSL